MKTNLRMHLLGPLVVLASSLFAPVDVGAAEFTTDFDIERCTFSTTGRQNPYFSLQPGDILELEGEEDGEELEVEIKVQNQTRQILFETPEGETLAVTARVVREREWVDDEIVEISFNWYARCTQTNDIFYFGEAVDIYEDGQVVSHDGSWEAGIDGAQPGIIMPARFLLGSRYYQESAPEVALDRAKHVAMDLEFEAAGEIFEDCVAVDETTPLEPGHVSPKAYCPGVGLVMDGPIVLVEYER